MLAQYVRAAAPAGPATLQQARRMATNKMGLIKELRASSGAPLGDVKSALEAADWDVENAYTELRKKGLAAAAKKASRSATQGLLGVAKSPGAAVIVEVNSETDFVAKNERFLSMLPQVAQAALAQDMPTGKTSVGPEEMGALSVPGADQTVAETVLEVASVVRENVVLRRGACLHSPGAIFTYIHNAAAENVGQIAAAVALETASEVDPARLEEVGGKLAMQVVAMKPLCAKIDDVPADVLAKERDTLTEQAKASGKPDNIIERIVTGRLSKFYEESVLLEQRYLVDEDKKVKQVLKDLSKEVGTEVSLGDFIYMKTGEES